MKWILRFVFGLVLVGGLGTVLVLLTRYLHPEWWRRPIVRRAAFGLPAITLVVSSLWLAGFGLRVGWLLQLGAFASAVCLVFMVGLIGALPLSGLVLRGRALVARWRVSPAGQNVDPGRRQLIQGAAAIFPLASVTTGSVGIARSFGETRVYRQVLRFPGLPAPLEGLRILHLTDVHLGIYKTNDDLADALRKARAYSPQLILLTGDIADDLTLLPGALAMTHAFGARYGVFSSLGNHEYSRGIAEVKQIYARSPVTLLRDSGATINVGGHPVYLAGCDDPRYMKRDDAIFLRRSVDRALERRPAGVFNILLSHRPEGFVPAAERGVHLTLSGHTHGGQMGFAGRSLWQSIFPQSYLWGHYRRAGSQMYLSAGMGHWFPFRLGCPTEAPVLELRRA
jgi:uncharacterized protein